jgi:hypothetical protein
LYFASPAVDVAFFLNLTGGTDCAAYLDELRSSLEAYDGWLWSSRNDSACCGLDSTGISPHCCPAVPSPSAQGLLWSTGVGDTGEDGSDKFSNNTTPIQSMDMMGYSHDTRRALARIAGFRGDAAGVTRWTAAAAEVAATLKGVLWRSELGACFDKDVHDRWVTTLVHSNLRAMWHGVFDQHMADTFVARHLMNRSEFWTPMPLTSIAISDPRFQNKDGNNWSGPPEGLTLQRAIRALESYGHHAELIILGLELTEALLPRPGSNGNRTVVGGNFPQQIHPFTAVPQAGDGYGPMILSLLEHTALRVGVVPRPERGLLWSCWHPNTRTHEPRSGAGVTSAFTQVLGHEAYTLVLMDDGTCRGTRSTDGNGSAVLFEAAGTLRVVTDLAGAVIEIWGISNTTQTVTVALPDPVRRAVLLPPLSVSLAPNDEWGVAMNSNGPQTTIKRKTSFYPPF